MFRHFGGGFGHFGGGFGHHFGMMLGMRLGVRAILGVFGPLLVLIVLIAVAAFIWDRNRRIRRGW